MALTVYLESSNLSRLLIDGRRDLGDNLIDNIHPDAFLPLAQVQDVYVCISFILCVAAYL